MIRYLIGFLITILALTFLRAVMKLLMKGASDALRTQREESGAPQTAAGAAKGTMLRKCGSCGTFAPEARMRRRRDNGTDTFFCSAECEQQV